ncbi:hypothetical protein [Methylosinus sp. RM1]|uniref:hypothetical protein n=1 Tax=Methylosinus sp. RM1 TaxID=2583817 RepID=UPI001FEF31B9|nr:hypothetical protein [Methylosinus sp. RM1]
MSIDSWPGAETSGPNAGDGAVGPLIIKINLTPQEKSDLLVFLKTLRDESLLASPRFADPWRATVGAYAPSN